MDAAQPDVTSFFGPDSPYLTHPLLTEERTATEIDEIEAMVGPVNGRHVLDIGCGFGRHSIELARRGAVVTAVDPSAAMVGAARERAAAAGVFVDVARGRVTDLGDVGRYDLALCLFTTLGQRDPADVMADDDLGLLGPTRRALRPGAPLIIELPDRERTVAAKVDHEQLGPTTVGRCFDPETNLFTERFDLATGASFDLAYRLYDTPELNALLTESGFVIEARHERPLVSPPPNLATVIARRPG